MIQHYQYWNHSFREGPMPEYLTLQGKNIPYVRGVVPVDKCDLDPANPRIQYLIGQRGAGLTQNELDELIWGKDAVKALADSIKQNGGVYEAVIAQRRGDRLLIREGNCRTVSCRHLLEQFPNDTRFMTMPAMIFDVDLSEEDLAVLLADMHVAGKIRWDAYEQAKHVHDLFTTYGKTYDWLSSHLRLSRSKIAELLSAYKATTDYLAAQPGASNVRKFSMFQEVMKKKELRQRYADDVHFKQRFFKWLLEERITDPKQVRDLPAVLENVEATRALEAEGFPAAAKVLIRDDPSLESNVFWAVKSATEALKATPASDIQDLKSGNPQKVIMLRNLHRAIEDLSTLAGVKL
jgi:hypothetical protein